MKPFLSLSILLTAWLCAGATLGQTSLLDLEDQAIAQAVNAVADSVVQIRTIGGLDRVEKHTVAPGPTTGLIVSTDGYILSSAYGFVQEPASILVTLPDGNRAPAERIATDHSRMLVLLRVRTGESLPVPTFAADNPVVGSWAIALGKVFHADQANVSVGIVSAVDRLFGKVIQTDAATSAANYGGPLIDIRGQVLGVIVPMSPGSTSEVAGVKWYDSGVGFAVPLGDMADVLERMKQGLDQYPGKLGVGLKNENPFVDPPMISTTRPKSPAAAAGLQKGDIITELNGQLISTLTDLRYAMGPLYAGDTVTLSLKRGVTRGEEQLQRTFQLSDLQESTEQAFLGILPMRPAAEEVLVRAVYADSPANLAGIKPGDEITQINQQTIANLPDAYAAMANIGAGETVTIQVLRSEKATQLQFLAAQLPTEIPDELPPATSEFSEPDENRVTGIQPIKLTAFRNQCQLYTPEGDVVDGKPAILLHLGSTDGASSQAVIEEWKTTCDQYGIALVVPLPLEPSGWERSEFKYLRKLLNHIESAFEFDSGRVVVHGTDSGQLMALLLGLLEPDKVRGISLAEGHVPRGLRIPKSEPNQRLAFLSTLSEKHEAAMRTRLGLRRIAAAGYPVAIQASTNASDEQAAANRGLLGRWIDSLDHF